MPSRAGERVAFQAMSLRVMKSWSRLLGGRRARAVAAGPLALLSVREREVFDLLLRGYSGR